MLSHAMSHTMQFDGSVLLLVYLNVMIIHHLSSVPQVGSITGFGQSIASVARMVTPLVAGAAQQASLYGPGLIGTLAAAIGATFAGYVSREVKLKEL